MSEKGRAAEDGGALPQRRQEVLLNYVSINGCVVLLRVFGGVSVVLLPVDGGPVSESMVGNRTEAPKAEGAPGTAARESPGANRQGARGAEDGPALRNTANPEGGGRPRLAMFELRLFADSAKHRDRDEVAEPLCSEGSACGSVVLSILPQVDAA